MLPAVKIGKPGFTGSECSSDDRIAAEPEWGSSCLDNSGFERRQRHLAVYDRPVASSGRECDRQPHEQYGYRQLESARNERQHADGDRNMTSIKPRQARRARARARPHNLGR
jgi:hypothetical protein